MIKLDEDQRFPDILVGIFSLDGQDLTSYDLPLCSLASGVTSVSCARAVSIGVKIVNIAAKENRINKAILESMK
jgi:hypothetical protein